MQIVVCGSFLIHQKMAKKKQAPLPKKIVTERMAKESTVMLVDFTHELWYCARALADWHDIKLCSACGRVAQPDSELCGRCSMKKSK